MRSLTLQPTEPWFVDDGITHRQVLDRDRIFKRRQEFAPSAPPVERHRLESVSSLSMWMHLPELRLIFVQADDMVKCPFLITPPWTTADGLIGGASFPTAGEARYLTLVYRWLFEQEQITHVAVIVYGDPHQLYDLIEVEYADPTWERRVVHIPLTVVAHFDCDENPE